MKRLAVLLAVATLGLPHAGWAQQSQEPPAPSNPPALDVTRMGVSLDRIRRELRETESTVTEGPRLAYRVQVFGQAPPIDIVGEFPLTGPVPYGGPTHRDVLDFLTPQEFRSPPANLSQAAFWAVQWLQQRSARQRCEQEIAEYRQLVMQGVAIAAPRCAR